MGIPAIISLVITALSVMLFASLFRVHRIKCLIAAVLGTLLSGLVTSLLSGIGLGIFGVLGVVLTIACITLIAWLFGQHRIRTLLAVVLGVLISNWINSLIMPILNQIFG
ncbi:MAG: hypothetical protein E7584_02235 [Ruminococcaceae bacterium]|nr:hypothetical protein [Oscillospiraceae bacterium]